MPTNRRKEILKMPYRTEKRQNERNWDTDRGVKKHETLTIR